jgi:ferredoxin/flavodoxin---NADP+ reductase
MMVRNATSGLLRERILSIRHYTDKLFSFTATRAPSFRFQSGQFAMIGLENETKPLLRAYSMTSAYYDDHLEFFSIKVPDGPLTSRLQHIAPGDELLINSKVTGTLTLGNLQDGDRLILVATGTGFAPFASILRDPETYERYDRVIAIEGCRTVAETAFARDVVDGILTHELLGSIASEKLMFYPTVTREPFEHQGRSTELIRSGKLFEDLSVPTLDASHDRVMLCGNPGMLRDLKSMLTAAGFVEGSSGVPGTYVIEKAFVER